MQLQDPDHDTAAADGHQHARALAKPLGQFRLDPVIAQDIGNEKRDAFPVAGTREATPERDAKAEMRCEAVRDCALDKGIALADLDRAGLGGGDGAHRARQHSPEALVEVAPRRRDAGQGRGDSLALAPDAVAIRE